MTEPRNAPPNQGARAQPPTARAGLAVVTVLAGH